MKIFDEFFEFVLIVFYIKKANIEIMINFFGLVAQMVDRRLGMAEAPGSNPGQSTLYFKGSKTPKFSFFIFFHNLNSF